MIVRTDSKIQKCCSSFRLSPLFMWAFLMVILLFSLLLMWSWRLRLTKQNCALRQIKTGRVLCTEVLSDIVYYAYQERVNISLCYDMSIKIERLLSYNKCDWYTHKSALRLDNFGNKKHKELKFLYNSWFLIINKNDYSTQDTGNKFTFFVSCKFSGNKDLAFHY